MAIMVTLKLFASLTQHLPPDASGQQAMLELAHGTTPADVIHELHTPPEKAHLVLVDGIYLSPEERSVRVLAEGEVLAIWPLVAGG